LGSYPPIGGRRFENREIKNKINKRLIEKTYRGVEQLVARWAHIRRLADVGSRIEK